MKIKPFIHHTKIKLISFFSFILIYVLMGIVLSNVSYRYYSALGEQIIHDPQLTDTDCISLSNFIREYVADLNENKVYYSDLLSIYKESPYVDKVYGFDVSNALCDGNEIQLLTAYPETYDLIRSDLSEGRWFDISSDSGAEDYPAAVVCGAFFSGVHPGDIVSVQSNSHFSDDYSGKPVDSGKNREISVRVIGKIQFPYIAPDFSNRFTEKDAHISDSFYPVIYLLHDQNTVSKLNENQFNLSPLDNYIYVHYTKNDDASREHFRSYVRSLMSAELLLGECNPIQPTSDFISTDNTSAMPFYLEYIFNSVNLALFVLCWIIITSGMLYNISVNSRNLDNIKNSNISFPKLILNNILITAFSAVTAALTFSIRAISLCNHSESPTSSSIISEFLCSEYTISIFCYLLLFWILLNLTAAIVLMIKINKLKKSVQKTKNSFEYRPPEYYENYDERDFEISQDQMKQPPLNP